jgi:two-component system sensor kinase FixL
MSGKGHRRQFERIQMSDTIILTKPLSASGEEERLATWRAMLRAGVLIALCVGLLAWICLGGDNSISGHSPTAGESTAGTRPVAGMIAQHPVYRVLATGLLSIAGIGAMLAVVSSRLASWQRGWVGRLQATEEELRSKAAGFQLQLSDCQHKLAANRKTEEVLTKSLEEARAQHAQLLERHSALQAELDARAKAEKTLSQQRQLLESSKTVLEIHVEARTQELQKLQHRYELILNSAGDGVCGLDSQGKITFVNPAVARITGWPIEELIGKTERDIFHANGSNGHAAVADRAAGEQVFCRKSGARFPVEFVRTRIEEGGRQTGSVLIFKDITERKRAEESLSQKAAELARSNAELEQFAFVASHDLQEPLRKIQAFGDRLKAKLDESLPPQARDYLDRMQNAAARMRTLIDDLLAFSRVIRNSEPFATVDLKQITKEVLGDLELRIEKSAGRVEVGDLPTIEADATQMRQLMLNLIGNALKFQAPGAHPLVKIHSRQFSSMSGEQFCEITIQDNGIGFEEQYAEKIFAVFQRLHGRGEYEGTGVGLAVCRRITDRHGGTIVAKSKLGEGSAFIVTLPCRCSNTKSLNE